VGILCEKRKTRDVETVERVPCLNVHSTKTLTCGTPWGVAWDAYVSGYGRWWEAWRCQILRGASFALVWWREERGANASKAGNILVIQVIVAIVFGKEMNLYAVVQNTFLWLHTCWDVLGCGWLRSGCHQDELQRMTTAQPPVAWIGWSIKRPGTCRRSDVLSQQHKTDASRSQVH
jgi:hypothetical protein